MPLNRAAVISPLEKADGDEELESIGRLFSLTPHLVDLAIQGLYRIRFTLLDGPRPPMFLEVSFPRRTYFRVVVEARRDAGRTAAFSISVRVQNGRLGEKAGLLIWRIECSWIHPRRQWIARLRRARHPRLLDAQPRVAVRGGSALTS